MKRLDWKLAEQRMNSTLNSVMETDICFVMNIIAPLKTRYLNGERSLRLYNEMMNLGLNFVKTKAVALKGKTLVP